MLLTTIMISMMAVLLAITIAIARRQRPFEPGSLTPRFDSVAKGQERVEREIRDEIARSRDFDSSAGRDLRKEVTSTIKTLAETLVINAGEIARLQNDELSQLRGTVESRLKELRDDNAQKLEQMRITVDEKLQGTLEKRL